jgi:hypothetical protein
MKKIFDKTHLPALNAILEGIKNCEMTEVNALIADTFGVDQAKFTTSMDSAYSLLDLVASGEPYMNVDFREYTMHVICDISSDGSGFSGSHLASSRELAFLGAIIVAVLAGPENE